MITSSIIHTHPTGNTYTSERCFLYTTLKNPVAHQNDIPTHVNVTCLYTTEGTERYISTLSIYCRVPSIHTLDMLSAYHIQQSICNSESPSYTPQRTFPTPLKRPLIHMWEITTYIPLGTLLTHLRECSLHTSDIPPHAPHIDLSTHLSEPFQCDSERPSYIPQSVLTIQFRKPSLHTSGNPLYTLQILLSTQFRESSHHTSICSPYSSQRAITTHRKRPSDWTRVDLQDHHTQAQAQWISSTAKLWVLRGLSATLVLPIYQSLMMPLPTIMDFAPPIHHHL